MDAWITFWKWIYIIGLGSFSVLVLFLIPTGAKDLLALFRQLRQESDTIHEKTKSIES